MLVDVTAQVRLPRNDSAFILHTNISYSTSFNTFTLFSLLLALKLLLISLFNFVAIAKVS